MPALPGFAHTAGANQIVPPVDCVDPPARIDNAYGARVCAVVADGNETAGIRLPPIAVPLGTHTGWNVYQRLTMTFLLLLVPLILVVALILANRAVYEITSRNGYYCAASLGLAGSTTEKIGAAQALFSINNFCWASGLVLVKDVRYRVTLTIPEDEPDWFDYDIHTDVEGFPSTVSLVHVIAAPFRRWWTAWWFKPIARIGTRGSDEYTLNPILPLPPLPQGEAHGEVVPIKQPDHFKPIDIASAKYVPTRTGRGQLISELTARSSGELFLYVNDAALTIRPGWPSDGNYSNNFGTARVVVERAE
jgi:hypothetical protein